MNEQEKKDRNLGLALMAGGMAMVGVGAYVIHRRKVTNVVRGMQLLMDDENRAAWQDGYDEAVHRFLQDGLAKNLTRLNNLQYPAA